MGEAATRDTRAGGTRRLVRAYKIFCVAFAAFLVLYAGVRIGLVRSAHQDEARAGFQSVRSGARSAMAAFDSRDDVAFSSAMRDLARRENRLRLLAVYEENRGVYYFLASAPGLFPVPPAPTADLTSVPVYRAPAFSTIRLVSSIGLGATNRSVKVEALYGVLGPDDLVLVGKEAVYLLLVLGIVTATMLLVVATTSARSTGRVPRARETALRVERAAPQPQPQANAAVASAEQPSPALPRSQAQTPPASAAAEPAPRQARPGQAARPAQAAQQPTVKSLYNELTGLVYQEHLAHSLGSEIDRAASSDQDMVLVMLGVDGLGAVPESERIYASVAERLREAFPFRDLVFEHERGYAVIIPDINLDKALERVEDFRLRMTSTPVEGRVVTISAGIAARNGRLIAGGTLLKEASRSLAKAVRDGANQVVAFRADPDKFRRVIAS